MSVGVGFWVAGMYRFPVAVDKKSAVHQASPACR